MGKPTRREALGSINILREELNEALVLTHHQEREFYSDGSKNLHTPKTGPGTFPLDAFTVDPEALADYKRLIAELREQHTIIVFVQPPLYESTYQSVRGYMARYVQETGLIASDDLAIDFNSPAYKAFRTTSANFDDGIHLSHDGALQLSTQLNRELQKLFQPVESHQSRPQ